MCMCKCMCKPMSTLVLSATVTSAQCNPLFNIQACPACANCINAVHTDCNQSVLVGLEVPVDLELQVVRPSPLQLCSSLYLFQNCWSMAWPMGLSWDKPTCDCDLNALTKYLLLNSGLGSMGCVWSNPRCLQPLADSWRTCCCPALEDVDVTVLPPLSWQS